MYMICTICHDNFTSSEDISATRCGHTFHLNCLARWLTRSKTCPECREITSEGNVQRLHVTFSNNGTNTTNNLTTQERIDSLKFQVLLNEKNIKYYKSKNETLEKQNAGLRQEVRKVESEFNKKNSTIYLLKEQIRDLKEKHTEHEVLKYKLLQKEKEMENLQYVKKLLYGSVIDAEEVVEKTDHDTLITYMKAMKRNMSRNTKNWELLYKHIKRCAKTHTKIVASVNDQFKRPETTHDKHLVDNMIDLQNQISEMEKFISLKTGFNMKSSISNSETKLNENPVTNVQEVRTSIEANEGEKTKVMNSLALKARELNENPVTSIKEVRTIAIQTYKAVSTSAKDDSINANEDSTSANEDKHSISKKRAKLL